MEPFTLATSCSTCVRECCWNRLHQPHVATQVADTFSSARQFHSPEVAAARRLVAAHVASVKGLGNKLSDLCPSPFTLATCAATCVATCVATYGQCESTISHLVCASRRVCTYNSGDVSYRSCVTVDACLWNINGYTLLRILMTDRSNYTPLKLRREAPRLEHPGLKPSLCVTAVIHHNTVN